MKNYIKGLLILVACLGISVGMAKASAYDWNFSFRNGNDTANVTQTLSVPAGTQDRLVGLNGSTKQASFVPVGDGLTLDGGVLRVLKTPQDLYYDGFLRPNYKTFFYGNAVGVTTTTNGSVVRWLTDDGTSSGLPYCAEGPYQFTAFVNDSNAVYTASYAVTDEFKKLTVTFKKQTFTGITVLGINVLGSTSFTAVPNGTAVNFSFVCD